jgi:hypothetical protein
MEIIGKEIKKLTKEKEWTKVFHKLNKNNFPCYYNDKYGINMKRNTVCSEYKKQIIRYNRYNRCLTEGEMIDAIKGNRWKYVNKKRLTNKFEVFWKKKKAKMRNLDWFMQDDINIKEKIMETKE